MLEKILFLDIETVPKFSNYSKLPDLEKELWDKKTHFLQEKENKSAEEIYNKAGIYAEFGKIICISVGLLKKKNEEWHFFQKSFFGDDEKKLLIDFSNSLTDFEKKNKSILLCAHNGKEFDYPYIARRMLVNSIRIPNTLNISGKKPWEVPHLDTMEMWKFGDYKHYTSLSLLAYLFGIKSPKDDIDGSQVANVYYIEKDIERIEKYCRKDVITVAQVFLKFKNLDLIQEKNIFVK